MKIIRIDEARYNQLLPQNVKTTPSDILSCMAKKTLAVLMNYQLVNEKAKEKHFVAISNKTLAQSVGKQETIVMKAVQELIELDLIEKKVGKSRTANEKSMASEYRIKFQNLLKPIQKKGFDELFSDFLESSRTPSGAANPNTNTYTNPNTNTYTNTTTNTDTTTNTNTEQQKPTSIKYFMDMVNEELVGDNDDELLDKRIKIAKELESRRIEMGENTYKRCSSYLSRKYNELIASI